MATTTEGALQARSIAPGFTVDDLTKSLKFYEALGFGIEDRWEHEGVLQGVMLRAGQARIALTQDDWQKGRDRLKGVGMRTWIDTEQNLDQVAAHAKAAGVTLDEEPHETEWGTRAFMVTDPDGFKLTISNEG